MSASTDIKAAGRRGSVSKRFKKELPFHLMIWIAVAFAIVFSYIPMCGLVIAFKDYKFRSGLFGSAWVGLKHFKGIFNDFYIGNAVINTVGLSLISLLVSLPITLAFAIMINELRSSSLKRVAQTISYLPHFVSWAIMAVIMSSFLDYNTGILNQLISLLGGEPKLFLGDAGLYWPTIIVASIWKETGWSAIVYLAVMTGIDESLYEAAKIDGAGRFQRIWYITLPSLSGIISIMLILAMGTITGCGFEQSYFLSNSLNFKRSNVLSYYVYQIGINKGNFSYSTAIGLITSTVSAGLTLFANWLAKKINGKGLF